MRRLAFISLLLLALAAAPAAHADVARYVSASGERLALYDGTGVARLVSRDGVAFGKVGRGRVIVTDSLDASGTDIDVWGAERVIVLGPRTRAYVNTRRQMGFSIVDGRWTAVIRARNVNASAVLVGRAVLSRGVSGTYQVRDGPRKRWPWFATTLLLG